MSASTLRSRFDAILRRLGIDRWHGQGARRLDLGSLRAGEATWLLQTTEDSELVRCRGRWLNSRTMEIYIREISSLQFMHKIPVFATDDLQPAGCFEPDLVQSTTPTDDAYSDAALVFSIFRWLGFGGSAEAAATAP